MSTAIMARPGTAAPTEDQRRVLAALADPARRGWPFARLAAHCRTDVATVRAGFGRLMAREWRLPESPAPTLLVVAAPVAPPRVELTGMVAPPEVPPTLPVPPGRRDDAARALATDPGHLRMARAIARSHPSVRMGCYRLDEAESDALLGLVEAARSFDPSRGVKFATFAPPRIRGAISDAIREARPGKRRGVAVSISSIDAPVADLDGLRWSDMIVGDDESPESGPAAADLVAYLLRGFLPGWKDVLLKLYHPTEATTMNRVGRELGLSESRISQIHSGAIAKIRARLAARGITRPEDLA